MSIGAPSRCELCGDEIARLDEHDRCEGCVLRAERIAEDLLADLESLVRGGLAAGLTPEQLLDAFQLALSDEEGELPGLSITRHPLRTSAGAAWSVTPFSAWLDQNPQFEPNRIRRLRRMRALSAEALADRLGVTVSELALWEHTPEVPEDIAEELAEIFGVSVPHLMKTDTDWLQG